MDATFPEDNFDTRRLVSPLFHLRILLTVLPPMEKPREEEACEARNFLRSFATRMRPGLASHAAEAKLGLIVEKNLTIYEKDNGEELEARVVVRDCCWSRDIPERLSKFTKARAKGRRPLFPSFLSSESRRTPPLRPWCLGWREARSRRIHGWMRIREFCWPKSGIRDARRVRGREKESALRVSFSVSNFHAYLLLSCPSPPLLPFFRTCLAPLLSSSFSTLSVERLLFETWPPPPVKPCQIMNALHSPFSSDFLFVSHASFFFFY